MSNYISRREDNHAGRGSGNETGCGCGHNATAETEAKVRRGVHVSRNRTHTPPTGSTNIAECGGSPTTAGQVVRNNTVTGVGSATDSARRGSACLCSG